MSKRMSGVVLSLSVAVLAGCGVQTGPGSVQSESVGESPGSCQDATYRESVKDDPFECKTFTSTEGQAPGQDLSWVSATPLDASFRRMNGSLTMVVRMPYGALNLPVSVGADTLTPDPAETTQTADGCTGPGAGQRKWITDYVRHPMGYALDQQTLVLTNELGRIVFERT